MPEMVGLPRSVIIDTDPGLDDAVAILFALAEPGLDVRAITTVAGNIGLATTTRNAGRLLSVAGRGDIPVHRGAAEPLARPGIEAAEIHGSDGMGGVALPEPSRPPADLPAVAAIASILENSAPGSVDMLALGPLTNVARLIGERPDAAARIGRIIAMGGAIHEHGNVGARSEFNFAVDPEAAEVVLGSGLDVTLIPLDVTRRVRADRAYVQRLTAASSVSARAAGAVIEAYFHDRTAPDASRPLHDPCVMVAAVADGLFGFDDLPLAVSLAPHPDGGTLDIVDGRRPIRTAMRVDGAGVLDLLARRLGA